ncbi:uncharacterized protein A1O9_01397 [Exophiala aquamarina CBS 119918]|uniref:Glutathione S-transferase n=1 Tax=Exophiala aquamarina CBS 119918 TaxID=1182545 RepID=A0A072PTJ4_9EURO|nr:uncharacterized protein A1O9_01397 [Exophiala aquamarina CBS 119918]KEF63419.1 hypothetical protein A1O9_01397 [Exophiala aquamarina CBS 119918]
MTSLISHVSTSEHPKIKLYTNHGCGWSQRVQITLRELKLPYEEVLLDLDKPRPDWFLELNPRGLVPVLQYTPASTPEKTHTLTESALIINFLTSLHPSHLTPSGPPSVEDSYRQYLTSFLTDTYFTKINPLMFKLVGATTPEAKEQIIDNILTKLQNDIEPLLVQHLGKTAVEIQSDLEPTYFLSSPHLTLAEISIVPFSMRLLEFSNGSVFPKTLRKRAEAETPVFYAWSNRTMANPHVWEYWGDSAYWIARIEERLPAAREKYRDS